MSSNQSSTSDSQKSFNQSRWHSSKDLIGAIDQGTSSTRFLVFESGSSQLVASSQIEIERIVPKEGWVEMDPKKIMDSVYETIENVHKKLLSNRSNSDDTSDRFNQLKCIGICNQRESTVVWDRETGEPLYNVILWLDNRTKDIVDEMIDSTPGRDFNFLKDKTGLPMSTYFSAFKLKWLLNNVPQVKQALIEDRLMFGTVDTWIIWNITGKHLTDVTNASRTFLMDIETLEWDQSLCKLFGVRLSMLPQIRSSADDFGFILDGPLKGIPITGVIGDQSAALFGHNCLQIGQTKATFGTGSFIMQNIGPGPPNGALSGVNREARKGLITTIGYKLRDKPACYALEGSVKIAGAALTWLRDNLQLITDYKDCDVLVNKTTHSAGVFFVPALGGLYAPYWDPNASGLMIGLSQFSRREHLVRATFDAIAYQTNDILNLMRGVTSGLMIDGGLVKSNNMCQILADITGCEIVRPSMTETSALGAAMIACYGANMSSFDKMVERSHSSFDCSSSAHRTHYYPPKALHYEEKFSSLSTNIPSSNESITSQVRSAAGRNHQIDNHTYATSSTMSTTSESDASQSLEDDDDREVQFATEQQQENMLNSAAYMRNDQMFYQTPSSGYGSTDNYDNNNSDARRDSPVSTQTIDKISESETQTSSAHTSDVDQAFGSRTLSDRVHENTNNVTSYSTSTVRPRVATSNSDSDYDNSTNIPDHDVEQQSARQNRQNNEDENDYSTNNNINNKQSNKNTVDIFQSYISLEHRTELVNTWKLAVERSMKWTKVDHEEIRRNDYQRLSSLPLSMYLFFSVGMLAFSGLLSGRS